MRAAAHFWANSESARDHETPSTGMAACALLAIKMNEVKTVDTSDVCDLDSELECFDTEEYGDLELEIIEDLEWVLEAPRPAAPPPLAARNAA